MIPVILCGGVGSRLWPVSRESHPKQYLNLVGRKTMLQETLRRASLVADDNPILICNEENRFATFFFSLVTLVLKNKSSMSIRPQLDLPKFGHEVAKEHTDFGVPFLFKVTPFVKNI